MNIGYSDSEFLQAKSNDKLKLICKHCIRVFLKKKKYICSALNGIKATPNNFCSKQCFNSFRIVKTELNCGNCDKKIEKTPKELKNSKSSKVFCSRSCAVSYNNTHKTKGCRRSKLEIWLESELTRFYPELEIHFNRKDTINSELDIFIPSFNLAFELNGIFHYEPIYGEEKLDKIKNNDNRKFQACLEQGIELCIIDSSSMKNFKPLKAQKYLDIICSIVKVARLELATSPPQMERPTNWAIP